MRTSTSIAVATVLTLGGISMAAQQSGSVSAGLLVAPAVQTKPAGPANPVQQPATPTLSSAEGEIVRVDTTRRTITIRTAGDVQMQFNYSDETKVTGGEKTVAGLATQAGTQVRVGYHKQGQVNVASEITVLPNKPA